mmetsp:Transcript_11324/g.30897  ORF Transcript_11324/g.30897 Transcript_11324/m.30897 type:complete len:216 (+) Transcript_11324:307-954(+)
MSRSSGTSSSPRCLMNLASCLRSPASRPSPVISALLKFLNAPTDSLWMWYILMPSFTATVRSCVLQNCSLSAPAIPSFVKRSRIAFWYSAISRRISSWSALGATSLQMEVLERTFLRQARVAFSYFESTSPSESSWSASPPVGLLEGFCLRRDEGAGARATTGAGVAAAMVCLRCLTTCKVCLRRSSTTGLTSSMPSATPCSSSSWRPRFSTHLS